MNYKQFRDFVKSNDLNEIINCLDDQAKILLLNKDLNGLHNYLSNTYPEVIKSESDKANKLMGAGCLLGLASVFIGGYSTKAGNAIGGISGGVLLALAAYYIIKGTLMNADLSYSHNRQIKFNKNLGLLLSSIA